MPTSLFESSEPSFESVEIVDGLGNRIVIPKWGCCSYAEAIAIDKELNKEATVTEHRKNVVTAFLKLRFRKEITPELEENLLCDRRGEFLPEVMLDNLYQFVMSEYNRDKPTQAELTIQGKNAKAIAEGYAKKHNGIVITRSDLEAQDTFYVFEDDGFLTKLNAREGGLKYYATADFTKKEVGQSLVPERSRREAGKSKEQTGTDST